MQASALYGLRLELPPLASAAGVAHVLAFFGWMFATIELISDKGGMRLVGYGLVLLALGGYEQASPVELCLSVLGLVAVAVGELRALPYTDRACRASACPSGGRSWGGWRRASATAPVPTRRVPRRSSSRKASSR